MNRTRAALALALVLPLAGPGAAGAEETELFFGGRLSYRFVGTTYPDGSLFREAIGSSSLDQGLDARFVFGLDRRGWDLRLDAQLIGVHGDTLEFTEQLPPELALLFGRLPEDETRLFDLTYVFTDTGRSAALGRVDRMSFGYAWEKGVVRVGRQAVTWGNGLVYNPMDIFNPFDPAAVDTEYKSGDDMIYGQYLWNGGDDLQGVMVFRRELETGDPAADASSLAFKYHGLAGRGEYDALAAQHYGDPLLGGGGNLGIGGAVWSVDLVVTFAEDETVAMFVTGATYSWTWGGKNFSGAFEYFFNGFGQPADEYDPASLAENPELLARIARGELFTLGRHYLAASTLIEITPLFLLTPNLFLNVADPSALVQVVTRTDLREDMVLLASLSIPIGAEGTEYGGIPTDVPGLTLSTGPGIFLQLAWYF